MKTIKSWHITVMEYLSYLTVFLVPLVVIHNHSFGYTGSKSMIFSGLVSIMALLFGFYLWRAKRFEFSLGWMHLALMGFVIVTAISAILGVDPNTSFFGAFFDGIGLVYIYACIFFAFIVGFLVKNNDKFLSRFMLAIFLAGVFVALKSFSGEHSSTLGNTSFTGAYLMFIPPIGIGLFLLTKEVWQKFLYAIGILVTIFTPLFFNFSALKGDFVNNPMSIIGVANGAALGLGISILIAISLFLASSKKNIKKYIGISLFSLVVLGTIFAGFNLTKEGTSLNQMFIEEKTATRFVYWDIAKEGFEDRPLLGYGFGNYDIIFQNHFNPIILSEEYATEGSIGEPHNIFWSLISTTGILGTFFYFLLIILACFVFFRNLQSEDKEKKVLGIIFIGLLFGYLVQNLFIFDTINSLMLFFSILGVSIAFSENKWSVNIEDNLLRSISVFLIIFAIVFYILFTAKPWRESVLWHKHFLEFNNNNPKDVSLVGNERDTVPVASKLLLAIKDASDTVEKKEKSLKRVYILRDDFAKEIEDRPFSYKSYLGKALAENLITLYTYQTTKKWDQEIIDEAKSSFSKALEINPKNPEIYLGLIQTNLYDRNFDEAYLNLRKVLEINPRYDKALNAVDALRKLETNNEFEKWFIEFKQRNDIS
jgi:O-antigen ligase